MAAAQARRRSGSIREAPFERPEGSGPVQRRLALARRTSSRWRGGRAPTPSGAPSVASSSEAERRDRAAELDRTRDRRAEELRLVRQLAPTRAREPAPSASSRSSHQVPSSGSSGASNPASAPRTDSAKSVSSGSTTNLTHRPPASTSSVCSPRRGAGPTGGGRAVEPEQATEHRDDAEPRLVDLDERARSHAICGSSRTRSRACTGPHGTPAAPSRSSQVAIGSRAQRALRRRRHRPLHRDDRRVVGQEVGRLDRRVVEPEEPGERRALAVVEAGDARGTRRRPRSSGSTGSSRAPSRSPRRGPRDRRGVARERAVRRLALEPDEVLHLHGQRSREQRDLDPLAAPPSSERARARRARPSRAAARRSGRRAGRRRRAPAPRHPATRAP